MRYYEVTASAYIGPLGYFHSGRTRSRLKLCWGYPRWLGLLREPKWDTDAAVTSILSVTHEAPGQRTWTNTDRRHKNNVWMNDADYANGLPRVEVTLRDVSDAARLTFEYTVEESAFEDGTRVVRKPVVFRKQFSAAQWRNGVDEVIEDATKEDCPEGFGIFELKLSAELTGREIPTGGSVRIGD